MAQTDEPDAGAEMEASGDDSVEVTVVHENPSEEGTPLPVGASGPSGVGGQNMDSQQPSVPSRQPLGGGVAAKTAPSKSPSTSSTSQT